MKEKGDIKIHVYVKNEVTDLVSGMIYKKLFFQKMYSIIVHSWGIQTIWMANLLPRIRWKTENKLKVIVGFSLSHYAFICQDFYIWFSFVFIWFVVFCSLFLCFLFYFMPQSSFLFKCIVAQTFVFLCNFILGILVCVCWGFLVVLCIFSSVYFSFCFIRGFVFYN